jgi:hypothetical protein
VQAKTERVLSVLCGGAAHFLLACGWADCTYHCASHELVSSTVFFSGGFQRGVLRKRADCLIVE